MYLAAIDLLARLRSHPPRDAPHPLPSLGRRRAARPRAVRRLDPRATCRRFAGACWRTARRPCGVPPCGGWPRSPASATWCAASCVGSVAGGAGHRARPLDGLGRRNAGRAARGGGRPRRRDRIPPRPGWRQLSASCRPPGLAGSADVPRRSDAAGSPPGGPHAGRRSRRCAACAAHGARRHPGKPSLRAHRSPGARRSRARASRPHARGRRHAMLRRLTSRAA